MPQYQPAQNVSSMSRISCLRGRGEANPPILQFDPSGKLLKSLGAGMFVNPHGFTVDREGNLWVSDINDKQTVLGMSARNAAGVTLGQEVLKLDQNGEVLMTLGKMGVGGSGIDTFDRPTGVAIGANGDIFISDGHGGNASNNARVLKFSKDGRFIKTWGHHGSAPGDFDDPHDIAIGGSMGRVYVADRRNSRIQVFDQDGNFISAWYQFGQPSSVFIGPDDKIYVGVALRDEATRRNASSQVQPGNASSFCSTSPPISTSSPATSTRVSPTRRRGEVANQPGAGEGRRVGDGGRRTADRDAGVRQHGQQFRDDRSIGATSRHSSAAQTLPGLRLRRIGGRTVIPVARIVMHGHENPTDLSGICLVGTA
jgi:DNA-binding beta-propeller fold protein YncE